MTLLIDVGNTRIKVGSTTQSHTTAISHPNLAQLLPWLQSHWTHWESSLPKQALGICVASSVLSKKIEQLLLSINCSIKWLDATVPCDLLHNNYKEPQRLGADRWLALIGVLDLQCIHKNRPIIHASFGTATTIDTIIPANSPNQKSQFIGGLILPGPQLMYDSLALNTAQLKNDIGVTHAFPIDTRAAISSGVSAAQAGAVMRQWQLVWQQYQSPPLLVCSGGGWPLIQEEITFAHTQQLQLLHLALEPVLWQPTPVLDGLSYMSKRKA